MSRPSSDRPDVVDGPLRPSDHLDRSGDAPASAPTGPQLGFVGWLRWGWRQLTSMRTALALLFLLALAAIPGSVLPQRATDPIAVTTWLASHPGIGPVLDTAPVQPHWGCGCQRTRDGSA